MRGKPILPRPAVGRRAARRRYLLAAALAGLALLAALPPAAAGAKEGDDDPFRKLVFAPELVMKHQSEIGLTADQKAVLVAELQSTQSDLVPLQLEISETGEQLARLLAAAAVDEASALDVAERVMRTEAEIKKRHLALVIRIKNLLTPEQQAKLREIRARQAG